MVNFFKKTIVTLTAILVASSLAAGASAYAAGTSCTGSSSTANVYSGYSNTSGSCNLQGIDVNSILSKLGSYGCTEASANTSNCNGTGCNLKSCAGADCAVNGICTTNTCTAGNCTTSTCAANGCTNTGNQTAALSATDNSKLTANVSLAQDVKSAAADYAAGFKKLCKISYGTAITTAAPKSSTSVTPKPSASPASTSNSGSVSADNESFEQQVLALVNEQRAAIGLSPLTLSTELSNVARVKSQDMSDNNYFSHTSPSYGSPFDMLKTFGISYRTAGENIAMGYATPQAVMNAWMNSAGHRANILNASFTQIGIGYVADGNYWTQEFIG
ncbi:MAG: hypothetical protein EOM51_03265 [Clostridia bacterium]|nr:hypothetical protein [Clostridia bacterium]